MSSDVGARLLTVRERMAAACRRAGRPESAVTLVAVCKGQPVDSVLAALQAGHRVFAENYAQELVDKADATPGRDIAWHFVGGLQRNKVKKVVGRAALIQSVDSAPLAAEIDRRAAALGLVQDILVQVDIGQEAQKSGAAPEDLPGLLDTITPLSHLRCRGLMAIPPAGDDPEAGRRWFRALADLAARHGLAELSMGMSSDFEAAIEEGATLVRVGTAIFGDRP